jgi:ribosome-associated protein
MDIRKLQRAIVDGLEDVKAHDIRVFNTEHLSPLFERVIVASGTSNRQTKALASSVRETVKKRGLPVMRTEGEENGEWIIVDCGAAVAHIMQPAIRQYYNLEEIWGDKPVHMKMDHAPAAAVQRAPSKKPPAKKKAAPARGQGRGAAPAAPAKKKHKAPAKPSRPPAKKAVAKKPAPRKAPARKSAATPVARRKA